MSGPFDGAFPLCTRPFPRVFPDEQQGSSEVVFARVNMLPIHARAAWTFMHVPFRADRSRIDVTGRPTGQSQSALLDTIVHALIADNFFIPQVLCDFHQSLLPNIEMASVLLRLANVQGRSLDLVTVITKNELRATTSPDMVLRRNNGTSRILLAYASLTSKQYLRAVLEAPLRTMAQACSPKVDDSIFFQVAQVLIDLFDSVSPPPQLCALLKIIFNETMARFGESARRICATFYFLRVICPAVVSPLDFGLISTEQAEDKALRMPLLTLSKLLQALATGRDHSLLEDLPKFAPFLEKNANVMDSFFERIMTSNVEVQGSVFPTSGDLDVAALKFVSDLTQGTLLLASSACVASVASERLQSTFEDICRYISFGFSSTIRSPKAESSLFYIDQLEDVLLDPEFNILYRLAKVLPSESLEVYIDCAIAISLSRGCGLSFVSKAINDHLLLEQSFDSLISSYNPRILVSLAVSAYTRLTCSSFLMAVLGKVLADIIKIHVSFNAEMVKDWDVLAGWVVRIGDQLLKVSKSCPSALKSLTQLLNHEISRKSPAQAQSLLLKFFSRLLISALKTPHLFGILPVQLTQQQLDNSSMLGVVLERVISGELFELDQPATWSRFNPLISKTHSCFNLFLNKVLLASVPSGALSQWEHSHMNRTETWPRYRVKCLSTLNSELTRYLGGMDASILQQSYDDTVVYSPIDRLYTVMAMVQLTW